MICEKYFDSIDDLVGGELDAQTAARVDSHVFACSDCRGRYEILKREREIYARYLFDAEPPSDLWTNFQAKLDAEKTQSFAEMPAKTIARKTSIFGFPLWFPAAASAALLAAFGIGFGWLQFAANESSADKYVAEYESSDLQSPKKPVEFSESKPADLPAKAESGENNFAERNDKFSGKSETIKARNISVAVKKSIVAEPVKAARKAVVAGNKSLYKIKPKENESNGDERLQKLRMNNLEKEIAGQIERVEMLLRSFRNARAVESDETFDVGYERGQARRLLERNVRLRRDAENYEIKYAEELLSRVEPYLLDIANLAQNPAPETVLDIRERVKNQSIIASLQIY